MTDTITCSKGIYDDHIHIEWSISSYPVSSYAVHADWTLLDIATGVSPDTGTHDYYTADDGHFGFILFGLDSSVPLANDTGWVTEHSSSSQSSLSSSSKSSSSVSS